MSANPALGVTLHWIGGLAGASFYLPYLRVRHWAWETYWLTGGIFSWLFAPMLLAWLLVPNIGRIISSTPAHVLFLTFFFGALWGVGGITYGLAIRYLGVGLGIAVALGYCAAFGSLIPPLMAGNFQSLLVSHSGEIVLLGVLVCLGGVVTAGLAGMFKEKELGRQQKKDVVEFSFGKGFLIATFAGIMSSFFALALQVGDPIATVAKAQLAASGDSAYWQGLPVLVVTLWGGLATNFIWCVVLHIRNQTGNQYVARTLLSSWPQTTPEPVLGNVMDAPGEDMAMRIATAQGTAKAIQPLADTASHVPLLNNYAFSALAGTIWYLQLVFYTMGQTKLGKYQFSGWTLHMASLIIFATVWGLLLKEWKGTSRKTHFWIGMGLILLIGSTIIIGYGNYLATARPMG
ncbi:MAG: L-rhamnose/proton symporter RhaT [Phycisphaerae bacterium]